MKSNDNFGDKNLTLVNRHLHQEVVMAVTNRFPVCSIMTGSSKGAGNTLKQLTYGFDICQPLSKDEARGLLIGIIETFLYVVNHDEFSKPWFYSYPFNFDSLEVVVFIQDRDGNQLSHPSISIVEIEKGKVKFRTREYDDIPKYVETSEEPFEEAYFKIKKKKFDIKDYVRD